MSEWTSWAAISRSLSAGIKTLVKQSGRAPNDVFQMQLRDRLLVRIFDADPEGWVLKGGTSMLARTIAARSTGDVDLVADKELEEAIADLQRLAGRDFGDYLTFQLEKRDHPNVSAGGRTTIRLTFGVMNGANRIAAVKIDLVVGLHLSVPAEVVDPDSRITLPGLPVAPYRLYPAVHSVADKVAATMTTYAGGPSTRDRDLVDLVIYAVTEAFDADALLGAIAEEVALRRLDSVEAFHIPNSMARGYERGARNTIHCVDHRTFADADALMQAFITPLLSGQVTAGTWADRSWVPPA